VRWIPLPPLAFGEMTELGREEDQMTDRWSADADGSGARRPCRPQVTRGQDAVAEWLLFRQGQKKVSHRNLE
jgi:hypothetical protein